MLEIKRNRRQNKKYSDFVQIPLTKRNHVKAEQICKMNGSEATDIVEWGDESSDVPAQDEYFSELEPVPFILRALPSLLHCCSHHDLLVITSDRATIPCHALMLSLASPVLSQVLKEQVVGEEDGMIKLVMESMNKEQFSSLLEFVYTGQTTAVVGLELIERFIELDIFFTSEVLDELKKESIEEELKVDAVLESWLNLENVRKETIVTTLTSLQNKENLENDRLDVQKIKNSRLKACEYCNLEYNTFASLKKHVRDHHANEYDGFLDNYGLLERFKCDYCPKGFKTSFQLKTHVHSFHNEEWEKFCNLYKVQDCSKCVKKFFTKEEVSKHERRVHKHFKTKLLPNGKHVSGRPVTVSIADGLPVNHERRCDLCGKIILNSEKFTDHMNAHINGKKPYPCEKCCFRSATRKTLRKHSALHVVSATPLLCNDCGNVFQCAYDLNQHRKKVHKHRLAGARKDNTKIKSINDFICEKCGQHFVEQQKYSSHIKFAHVSEEDKHQCPHCPHKSITQFSLKMHLALHYPPTLPCEQCGKLFHTKLYLTRHIKQNHADEREKDFQCAQCGKGFVTRDSYEGHLSMHAGVKPIKCRYCDMRYQNRSNAIAHEKKVHKDLYTRKTKSLGGVRVKDRMAGKEIIGLNKITTMDSSDETANYNVNN